MLIGLQRIKKKLLIYYFCEKQKYECGERLKFIIHIFFYLDNFVHFAHNVSL
jgi:hypothetical protein